MSTITIKHYNLTLANHSAERHRRIQKLRQQFRIRISKRKARQTLKSAFHKLHL